MNQDAVTVPSRNAKAIGIPIIMAPAVAADGDPERFTELDDEFHRGFARLVDLDSVWAIIEREKVQFDRVRFLSLPAVTPVALLIAQHEAILGAVIDNKPASAERAIRQHMSEVLRIAVDLTRRHPELIDTD